MVKYKNKNIIYGGLSTTGCNNFRSKYNRHVYREIYLKNRGVKIVKKLCL